MTIKVGDVVLASRKKNNSSLLSHPKHQAKVLAINDVGRSKTITLQYLIFDANSPQYDTIRLCIHGITGGLSATVKRMDPAATTSSITTEVTASSDTAVATSTDTAIVVDSEVRDTTAAAAPVDAAGTDTFTPTTMASSLVGSNRIPKDFGDGNAVEALGVEVPPHIQARWRLIDARMRIGELFGAEQHAAKALINVQLKSLASTTGKTFYNSVPARTNKSASPHMGLIELCKRLNIRSRTTEAKTKGLMFFFLACREPKEIVFPKFEDKPKRAPVFSLSEKGRLVGLLADTDNMPLVQKIMAKWDRAELDACAGEKGVAHYWNKIQELFINSAYEAPVNVPFAAHVETKKGYVYNPNLIPHCRGADYLRKQWNELRGDYGVFYSRYSKSGNNEPDATKYTTQLPVLLMHFTFHKKPLAAWAAKRCSDEYAIDDTGDGNTKPPSTRKRRRVSNTTNDDTESDRLLALGAIYETLHNVDSANISSTMATVHAGRMERIGDLMDKGLDAMSHWFE